MLRGFFGKRSQQWECTQIGCRAKTRNPLPKNPRFRWIVDLILDDPEQPGMKRRINLCPRHVREHLKLTEDQFIAIEKTENLIRENKGMVN